MTATGGGVWKSLRVPEGSPGAGSYFYFLAGLLRGDDGAHVRPLAMGG